MNLTNQEVNILTFAVQSAGKAVSDGLNNSAELEQWLLRVSEINTPILQQAKLEVTMSLKAAIRYQKTNKQSDAKLTCRHIEKVADEFDRLTRLVQRKEGVQKWHTN